MSTETIRPDADTALDGWTDQAGGTTAIYATVDESTASDSDYVQSPVISATRADLKVRLLQGSTTIVEWTHTDVSETFTTAEQTLTSPQLAAISDFSNLFIELDDNAGSVYKFSLGDPAGLLGEPVVLRYRYKKSSVTAPATSAEVTQFLARTTSLDGTHTAAYTALIDGLVADGIWSKLDALYIFATQDTTNALLNLKSSSYTPTIVGGLTFTADDGYALTTGSNYINTNMNASTAGGQYAQNSAHMSVWMFSDDSSMLSTVGTLSGTHEQRLIPNLGGVGYYRVNCAADEGCGGGVASGAGFSVGTRETSSLVRGYRNGTLIGTEMAATSATLNNSNFTFPNFAAGVGGDPDTSNKVSGGSFGSSLTQAEVSNFYDHMRTYMTAVGVP